MRRLQLLLSAVIFVDVMFYAAVAPLLPALTDEFGLSKSGAGMLMGAYAAGTVLGSLPAGWIVSRIGVRRTVIVGLTLMTCASVAFAFAQSIVILDVARFVQGLGAACSWAGGLAWLVAESPRERRGQVLGAVLGVSLFGAQFGPVLGWLATELGREPTFASTIALGLLLLVGATRTPTPAALPRDAAASPWRGLRDRRIQAGLWISVLPGVTVGVADVLFPLRFDELGASAAALSIVFFISAGASGLTSAWFGRIQDRTGPLPVVRLGLIGGALTIVLLQLPDAPWLLGVIAIAVFATDAILWVPGSTLLAEGAEALALHQGYAFAFFNLAWAGGMAFGSTVGGPLADATVDEVPYLICAAAYALTALATFGAMRRRLSRRRPHAPVRAV